MKVWILHRDELGEVVGIYSTREKAEAAGVRFLEQQPYEDPDDWYVQEWEVR